MTVAINAVVATNSLRIVIYIMTSTVFSTIRRFARDLHTPVRSGFGGRSEFSSWCASLTSIDWRINTADKRVTSRHHTRIGTCTVYGSSRRSGASTVYTRIVGETKIWVFTRIIVKINKTTLFYVTRSGQTSVGRRAIQ